MFLSSGPSYAELPIGDANRQTERNSVQAEHEHFMPAREGEQSYNSTAWNMLKTVFGH